MKNQGSVRQPLTGSEYRGVPAGHQKRSKIGLLIVGVALTTAVWGNACAGVVGASSPRSNGGTPPATQPALSANPMSAAFPSVSTGSSSSQTITLSNGGTANVTISQATVSGAGFSITGLAVPLTIQPGQNASFNAVFTPSNSGNATGAVALTSNAPNSPLTVAMSGSAITPTQLLSTNVSSLEFGDVLVGSSNSLTATLTNAGNADVTISSVSESGAGFIVTGVTANTRLAPGQNALLNVSFAPSMGGKAAGTVTVNSSASPAMVISLSGNGLQQSRHSVALAWDPSTSNVQGYYIYRGAPASGVYLKLNSAPVANTQFTDTSVGTGQSYGYVVTAVDAATVESAYSDEVRVVIP